MKCLITGASSGIGKDMCKILSKLGYELIMVSSNEKKLKDVILSYAPLIIIIFSLYPIGLLGPLAIDKLIFKEKTWLYPPVFQRRLVLLLSSQHLV